METYPRLMATFRPQAWQNDYALDVDGSEEFDATEAFLSLPLDEIRSFREHREESDDLASGLPAREAHHGPFEVDVDVDGWLVKNGLPGGRANLTREQLDTLRVRFSVTEGQFDRKLDYLLETTEYVYYFRFSLGDFCSTALSTKTRMEAWRAWEWGQGVAIEKGYGQVADVVQETRTRRPLPGDDSILTEFQMKWARLDSLLTGMDWQACARTARSGKFKKSAKDFLFEGDGLYYLSDGGYSRVWWDPSAGRLSIASESRQEVKDRWDDPAVRVAVAAVEEDLKAAWQGDLAS